LGASSRHEPGGGFFIFGPCPRDERRQPVITAGYRRKLTAILSADVKGYSRLMREDEAGTVRTLNEYKNVLGSFILQHRGRVVDAPGDNVLAEFASVVDAVQCAVEIQRELKSRNEGLPESRRMEFRIGINVGDVIEEGDRIYGDGVNIAARLEGLADPGGICVSGTVYEHTKEKVALRFEYLGEQEVKNIPEPVRAYRALLEGAAKAIDRVQGVGWRVEGKEQQAVRRKASGAKRKAYGMGLAALMALAGGAALWQFVISPRPPPVEKADPKNMAHPLPDKPSIAVLPFVNMSDDPRQDYFSDGLAEEIINALVRLPQVFVIARNSSFTYKGKSVDVRQVGREMGVKYVLEGSVRREGNRVRITAQLIDATTGNHAFSERYDRAMTDIFALQDEITMKVLTAMRVKWAYGEHERAMAKGTKNLEAYLKVLQGWEYCQIVNKESQALARQLAEEAVALDRGYAQAYRLLAQAIAYEVAVGTYQHREEALSRAMEMARKAVSLDDTLAGAHATLGYILMLNRDYDKAIAEGERAVALEPNSAEAYFSLGSYLFWSGRFEEGIAHLKKALSFTPIAPARYLNLLAHGYAAIGQYEEAISIYEKVIRIHPDHRNAHVGLVCAYVLSDREEEARTQIKEILRIDPKFSAQGYVETTGLLFKDQAFAERFRYEPLRKAGLK
jgi:adenylate cyclase